MFFILIVEPAHHRLTVIGCHRHEHVRVSSQGAKSRPSGHATYTKFLTDPSRNWNSADMRRRSSLAVFMSLLCRLADAEVLDPFCAPPACRTGPARQRWCTARAVAAGRSCRVGTRLLGRFAVSAVAR